MLMKQVLYTYGDGNCFFNAVCDQLTRLSLPAITPLQLRQRAVDYPYARIGWPLGRSGVDSGMQLS